MMQQYTEAIAIIALALCALSLLCLTMTMLINQIKEKQK